MSVDMALSRNLLYSLMGAGLSLLFLSVWEFITKRLRVEIVLCLLLYAYSVGIFSTFVVNQFVIFLFDLVVDGPTLVFLFGGGLNISLVMLVWCGFYLSLKQGLSF